MSKLSDALSKKKVHNDYEFFGDQPYIDYRPRDHRAHLTKAWMITKRGVSLSPYCRDYGSASFRASLKSINTPEFDKVRKYMCDQFGITELAKAPTGGWGDAEFVKSRIKEILNG